MSCYASQLVQVAKIAECSVTGVISQIQRRHIAADKGATDPSGYQCGIFTRTKQRGAGQEAPPVGPVRDSRRCDKWPGQQAGGLEIICILSHQVKAAGLGDRFAHDVAVQSPCRVEGFV